MIEEMKNTQRLILAKKITVCLLSSLNKIKLVEIQNSLLKNSVLLIKNYILQLFTNRLFLQYGLLFNYRILSETIQARIIQLSLDFMCTLIPSYAGFFCFLS